jgi:TatD DNase family protein
LGIHPWCVPGSAAEELERELDQGFARYVVEWGDKLVAVGEFGLDRGSRETTECFDDQISLFKRHMVWAKKLCLPVIIHSVKAHGKTLELLRASPPPKGGVLHSYSGPKEMIPNYAALGLAFSYSGNLNVSKKARESLLATPTDRILFETDGPHSMGFDTQEPVTPSMLAEVVETACQILQQSKEWCWSLHHENYSRIFGSIQHQD